MPSEKTLAIVLRLVEFSETSAVVTLFTERFGKIAALAKGARRPKSPFESALDLLATCRIVFLHKSSDALDLLTEAKLERRFRAASRDLPRLYAAYYVAELLDVLTDKGDPHPELFAHAVRVLESLDGDANVASTVLHFELSILRLLGHMPSLSQCVGCGKNVGDQGRVAFGPVAGGVLCTICRRGHRQVSSLKQETIAVLRRFAEPHCELWGSTEIDRKVRGEVRGVMNHYFASLLGKQPRMHRFLNMLTA